MIKRHEFLRTLYEVERRTSSAFSSSKESDIYFYIEPEITDYKNKTGKWRAKFDGYYIYMLEKASDTIDIKEDEILTTAKVKTKEEALLKFSNFIQ